MSDNQWVVDVADVDEENCVIRIWNMHCPECGYDPLANTASSITISGPERTENGTYFINGLNVPKTFPTCPKCGAVLGTDGNEKKKKTFLVEMDSAPVMCATGYFCLCPACLSGPHPMCLIAGAQVENLDHCPVLREITWAEPIKTDQKSKSSFSEWNPICPKAAGFDIGTCPVPTIYSDCNECKEKFWTSDIKKQEVKDE